jgi:hypothetical protein
MRFFKFGKRDSQTSSNPEKEPVTEGPPNTNTPVVLPVQEETYLPPVSLPPEKEKEDMADFFTINIYDIFQYDPKPVKKGKGTNGRPVEIFEVLLPEPELSTFFKVEILQYENKHYDLVFISRTNEVRDDLKEFIRFSCEVFGPDFMNKGSFNANDLRDAALGVFSRIWYNKARIDNTSFALTLILFNITPGQER